MELVDTLALDAITEGEALSECYGWDEEAPHTLEEYSRSRMLWICVLRQAVYDFVKTKRAMTNSAKSLHREVKGWLFSDTPTHFNSFLNICSSFELDSERWRREALTMGSGHMKRIELLGRRKPARVRVHHGEDEGRH